MKPTFFTTAGRAPFIPDLGEPAGDDENEFVSHKSPFVMLCRRCLTGRIQLGLISSFLCLIHLWLSQLVMGTMSKRVSYSIYIPALPTSENPPVPFSFAQRACAQFAQLGKKHF